MRGSRYPPPPERAFSPSHPLDEPRVQRVSRRRAYPAPSRELSPARGQYDYPEYPEYPVEPQYTEYPEEMLDAPVEAEYPPARSPYPRRGPPPPRGYPRRSYEPEEWGSRVSYRPAPPTPGYPRSPAYRGPSPYPVEGPSLSRFQGQPYLPPSASAYRVAPPTPAFYGGYPAASPVQPSIVRYGAPAPAYTSVSRGQYLPSPSPVNYGSFYSGYPSLQAGFPFTAPTAAYSAPTYGASTLLPSTSLAPFVGGYPSAYPSMYQGSGTILNTTPSFQFDQYGYPGSLPLGSTYSMNPFNAFPTALPASGVIPYTGMTSFQQPTVVPGFDLMKACQEQHPYLFNEYGQLKEGGAFSQAMSQPQFSAPMFSAPQFSEPPPPPAPQPQSPPAPRDQHFDLEASRRMENV